MEVLLEISRHNTDVHTVADVPLLTLAVRYKHMEMVRNFLRNGANPNVVDHKGNTPLHSAVKFQHVEIVRELLQHGADVHVTDSFGSTPLHRAVIFNNLEIVEALLECKAKVNVTNPNNLTPLHHALNRGYLDIVKVLLRHGGDVCLPDRHSIFPLHRAVIRGDVEIAKVLIKYQANVHVTNAFGFTPLHEAVCNKNLEMVKELLKNGASAQTADNRGNTPLFYALKLGNVEISEEFLQNETNIKWDLNKVSELLTLVPQVVPIVKLIIKHFFLQGCEGDNKKILNLSSFKGSHIYCTLVCYLLECVREIRQMKTLMVSKCLSLHEFVTLKNVNIALHPGNEWSRCFTDAQIVTTNYPIYYDVILRKVKFAVYRGKLLSKVKDIQLYSSCISNTTPERESVRLNDDCILYVAQYLSNADLEAFMQAFHDVKTLPVSSNDPAGSLKRQEPEMGFDGASVSNSCKKTRLE